MPHDVFISHSSKDKQAADAVCAVLERNGIRCWIAPRDILPGEAWGASIINAIQKSCVFILVFSHDANNSQQIEREVERAISKRIPVIPVRIEEVQPTQSLEYFISSSHWLDAFTQPFEQHLERVADAVRRILQIDRPSLPDVPGAAAKHPERALPPVPPPPAPPSPPELSTAQQRAALDIPLPGGAATPRQRSRPISLYLIVLFVGLAVASVVVIWGVRNGSQPNDFPAYARSDWKQTTQSVGDCMSQARAVFRDFKDTGAASESFVAWSDDYTFLVRCTSQKMVFFSLVGPPRLFVNA